MREILFRGKRVDNGKWDYSRCPDGILHSGVVIEDFVHKTVGEFTGLTDKNGTKIFEGDILKISTRDCGQSDGKGIVVVQYGKYGYDPFCEQYSCDGCEFGYEIEEYEVIGNVHDDPELIGGAEK